MKRINIYLIISQFTALLLLCSCNSFLDCLPDNRAEINSTEKVQKLLVSAYPSRTYVRMCELASDNCDDMGEGNINSTISMYQNSYWLDMTEAENESNVNIWQNYYKSISVANTALQAIEKMGETRELLPYKGEALLCRAYAHLCLTMLYCLPYDPEFADQYLGIPYIDEPETTLCPTYKRESLAEVYRHIDQDILAGLPLIDDSAYSIPKYHFNRLAAYAFAARFYLYYMKWDKVVEYADAALGEDASIMLRDWSATSQLSWDYSVRTNDYIDTSNRFNFMMIPLYSTNGLIFNAWSSYGARFSHNNRVSKTETFRSKRPMGGPFDLWKEDSYGKVYIHPPFTWTDNITNKVYMPKWASQWEVVDAVTGTGYTRSTFVAFTANELLLNRAEAHIQLEEYDDAVDDLNVWSKSFFKVGQNGIVELTRKRLAEVYGNPNSADYIAEYTSEKPTSRKTLHPNGFTVKMGEQEYLTQCLLYCKRIETIADGLRWCDIKRYGIEVDRFDDTDYIDDTTTGYKLNASLPTNDLRRAFQLPQEVISSGIEANPRNEDAPEHHFVK